MSLSTNITLTVSDYDVKLSRNLKFYEHDQLKLIFNLNYWGIDNANGVTQKVLMPLNALSAILFIETPLGVDSIESATIEENVVTFYLTSNQTQHIGVSRMQIQLSDADGCQITLPPMEFEVRENIYDDEVILSQVLLADEDENIVVDENGNAVNTGTQVSTQTYAIALSAEDETTATTSQPTKQIKDFNLKNGVSGEEDLLIQDSDGVTKRIKTSEFLNVDIDLTLYYTKEEIDTLLNNKADISHTHTTSDITDLVIPTVDVDKNYVDTQLSMKANIEDIPTVPTKTSELINDIGFITTIPSEYITENELNTELSTKANISDIPSLDGYATETFVTNKIAEASLSGGEIDLSGLATKDELNSSLAIKSDVGHTHEQYLTEHQDISMKADKTELHSHTNKTVLDGITSTKVTEWNNKSNFDGNYNSLTNKPTIPTVDVDKNYVDTQLSTKANIADIPSLDGYATETFVTNKIAEASLGGGGEVDLSGYATKDDLSTKADVSHSHTTDDINGLSTVATSGSYNDLIDKPTIPIVDVDKSYVDTQLATKANVSDIPNLDGYALKTEIPTVPTKTSELTNDSGFINSIPSEYVTETELNAKGYLTEHIDISGKANISDLATVATSGDYNDLLNKPTVTNGVDGKSAYEIYVENTTETPLTEIEWLSSLKGADGEQGIQGENGATFTPNVDTDGNLSWTNDKELENPTTINIKGAKGDKGEQGEKGADGKDGQDGLTTSISLNGTVYSHVDGTITLPDYPTIPTKTSDLINDSEFLTSIPTEYITEAKLNEKGYLTEHQDISGKANISDLSSVAISGNYNDLINTPTIPNEYILPIASTTTLGGIKVGSGLSIDTNGVLSATGTGGTDTGGTVGNGIVFNDSYIEDCNRWLSNGYVKTRPDTSNLPTLCTGVDRWGVLFFIAENATDGTGTQMYFPIDGTYKGRVFTRSLTAMSQSGGQASEWVLLAIQSDIPSIDGLATETYVNNKMIPNLVGNTVANKTLTLTVDKYQYAVLSNGDSVALPSVSSFTEIHLFFKASADLTLTFPSVRWQSIPSITSGHTYEIIFTYVVDEWLAGVICYE